MASTCASSTLRAAFRKKLHDGYFFRAEFQPHFASLLEQRSNDPDWLAMGGDPFARYGGQSLHTRSHGEAFLTMFSTWMTPGLIVMDEPEAALSPQRQLTLLTQMWRLVRGGRTQFVIATHTPILMTFPGAKLLLFENGKIETTRLEDTSHYHITKGILEHPERYWQHLSREEGEDDEG